MAKQVFECRYTRLDYQQRCRVGMIKSIKIERYRGFDQFQMDDLARVNLLVGKNNCGKTTVLECVHFLAAGGHPSVLVSIAERRGEYAIDEPERLRLLDMSHFFYGHSVQPEQSFSVHSNNGFSSVSVSIVLFDEDMASNRLFDDDDDSTFAIRFSGPAIIPGKNDTFPLSTNGTLSTDLRRLSLARYINKSPNTNPVVSITPDADVSENIASMWNDVLRTNSEHYVRNALQILEPTLDNVVFEVGGYRSGRIHQSAGILVGLENTEQRAPIGSFGDGMLRLLTMAISLVKARRGFLLIDEIDTGLHHSIMKNMWKLVVGTAIESNIQVFATTHSYDCIRGLADLCEENHDLSKQIALHKISNTLGHSVHFSGSELPTISEQEIEVR